VLTKKEIGDLGENLAVDYLHDKGYTILTQNWRYSRAEIDIIAKKEEILIFIEVKTRSYSYYGQPEDSITPGKEALIIDAAQRYMEKVEHTWEIRFDIISILLTEEYKIKALNHFEDAFY